MATPNKAQFLNDVLNLLKKRYKVGTTPEKLSVLEAVVFGICQEASTRDRAAQALESFKTGFFDWNEVRVSAVAELQSVLQKAGIPDAEDRATRLRRFLRQLFEKQYGFNLDPLAKKPLKESIKSLQEFEALGSDYLLASVIRLGLGGHAIGVDDSIRRALTRLGVAEPGTDDATLRTTLERAIPKTRGGEFVVLMEELARDTCLPGEPDCARCELRKVCPSSRTRKPEPGQKVVPIAKGAPAETGSQSSQATPGKIGAGKPSATKTPPATNPAPTGAAKPAAKSESLAPASGIAKPRKDKSGRAKP